MVSIYNNQQGTAGSATFDDGANFRHINQTSTLYLRGAVNSSVKDNLALRCCDATSSPFSVRTWPSIFYQTESCLSGDGSYLYFQYSWESESGNRNHLYQLQMGEHVIEPHEWNRPPYTDTDRPIDYKLWPSAGSDPAMGDTIGHWGFYPSSQLISASFTVTQYLLFRDPILDVEQVLMGPISISRSVWQDELDTFWYYKASKSGFSCPDKRILP
jgi:hypothetical protein